MNENLFYREAALRICGNLEIERGLHRLLRFVRDHMPLMAFSLQYYDHNYGSMRTIAMANEEGGRKADFLTHLSDEAKERALNIPFEEDAFLIEDTSTFPISRDMSRFHNIEITSIIVLILRAEKEILGFLVFLSEDGQHFTEEHLRLALLLREPVLISMANTLKHREVVKLNDLLADDNRFLHKELHRLCGDEIIGANFGLRETMLKVNQVATLDSPVLLMGETGSGKDVLANAIHYSSERSRGPLVSVNCGAIPESLIDSELFGHEKGAFTGAHNQKRGRFERAESGTIFLDEIGELPLQAQVRLLRVLQNKEIERVGGTDAIALDIRIIAATNRNLEQMVREGQFREDLWFRLNVFPIQVPPLRQRKIDIPSLVQYFINLKAIELKLTETPTLSPGAMEPLMEYRWPGNVRELQNIVERELILNPTGPLKFENLSGGAASQESETACSSGEQMATLDAVVKNHIERVLNMTEGKINGREGAAALLGINPSTLRNRMIKLEIEYGRKFKR